MIRAIIIAAMLAAATTAAAQAPDAARAVDGDTLDVAGQRMRLWGIDAPELAQTCQGTNGHVYECGRDAAAVLAELIRGKQLTCKPKGNDRYHRIVAVCSTESGDIGAEMVRRGWAVDYPRYSRGAYAAQQAEAKTARAGIWAGRFEMPAEFRKEHTRNR